MKCSDCKYSNAEMVILECHRYPPTLNVMNEGCWPKVRTSDFCGELEPKKECNAEYLKEAKRILLLWANIESVVQGRRADFAINDLIAAANQDWKLMNEIIKNIETIEDYKFPGDRYSNYDGFKVSTTRRNIFVLIDNGQS